MNNNHDSMSDLNALLRDQLQGLNRDFLKLLIFAHGKTPAESRLPNLFVPASVPKGLSELSPTALDGIAQCRYTLFSLAFHATETWRCLARTSRSSESIEQRYGMTVDASCTAVRTANATFLAIALTFAWHLHHSDPRLARVVLGLRDDTALAFEAIPLWRLQQIAHERLDLLTARWPDNPGFWPDLLKFAGEGCAAQLESARLVGAQLIAQELEPSSIQRLSPRARVRRR